MPRTLAGRNEISDATRYSVMPRVPVLRASATSTGFIDRGMIRCGPSVDTFTVVLAASQIQTNSHTGLGRASVALGCWRTESSSP